MRRLFTIAAALSLLMLATVAVLWVRSHRTTDMVGSLKKSPVGFEDRVLWSGMGRLGFLHLRWDFTGPTAAQDWGLDEYSKRPMGRYYATGSPIAFNSTETLGFHFRRSETNRGAGGFGPARGASVQERRASVHVPYWFLAVLFAALPALWAWRRWRRPGVRGFDVDATVTAGPAASSDRP